jgi:nucleoside-diphosphate-sugar epimerase
VAVVVAARGRRPALAGVFPAGGGEEAPRLQPFADVVCEVLGIAPAACEPAAAEQLGLYAPYADVASPFELGRARELGVRPIAVDELVPRLLAFAETAGWGRAPQPRPVAWTAAPAVG